MTEPLMSGRHKNMTGQLGERQLVWTIYFVRLTNGLLTTNVCVCVCVCVSSDDYFPLSWSRRHRRFNRLSTTRTQMLCEGVCAHVLVCVCVQYE